MDEFKNVQFFEYDPYFEYDPKFQYDALFQYDPFSKLINFYQLIHFLQFNPLHLDVNYFLIHSILVHLREKCTKSVNPKKIVEVTCK